MTVRAFVSTVPGPAAMQVRGRSGWLCACGQRVRFVLYVRAGRHRVERRELCARCYDRARNGRTA